jgi:hypothetical protein
MTIELCEYIDLVFVDARRPREKRPILGEGMDFRTREKIRGSLRPARVVMVVAQALACDFLAYAHRNHRLKPVPLRIAVSFRR